MIKRKYFFSVRVSHDNNTGLYSWYSGMATKTSWFKREEELMQEVRQLGADAMCHLVDRDIEANDTQFMALNRL